MVILILAQVECAYPPQSQPCLLCEEGDTSNERCMMTNDYSRCEPARRYSR